MGDRGNVRFIDERWANGEEKVIWMYTHWRGSELPAIVHGALVQHERWDDPPYLGRIIFQAILGNDRGSVGFGLSTSMGDGGGQIVTVDAAKRVVSFREREWSFAEYVKQDLGALLDIFHRKAA